MTNGDLVMVAAAVFVSAMVQAVSGFGFSLLAVPLMTLRLQTKEAVVVTTLMGAGVSVFQAWHHRHAIERAIAKRMVVGAYLGMPFGFWVFVVVGDHVLRGMLGIAVLISVALLALRVSLAHAGPSLDVGAGFLSGLLNTSLSTNGPPLVFALQARHLQPDAFRGTINTVFACSNVFGVTLFVAGGRVTHDGVLAAALALPALFAGQVVGMPLRRHVAGERFRVLVLVLLSLAAMTAIASALT